MQLIKWILISNRLYFWKQFKQGMGWKDVGKTNRSDCTDPDISWVQTTSYFMTEGLCLIKILFLVRIGH